MWPVAGAAKGDVWGVARRVAVMTAEIEDGWGGSGGEGTSNEGERRSGEPKLGKLALLSDGEKSRLS